MAHKRIQRVYGGAVPFQDPQLVLNETASPSEPKLEVLLVDQVDVLIATSVDPYYDSLLIDRAVKKNIPIVAESIEMPNQCTIVAVDNYQAGVDLGKQVGQFLIKQGVKKAFLLDLTFHQPNTRKRSQGFVDGLSLACPSEVVLSINSQSRLATAYQLARDSVDGLSSDQPDICHK